MMNLKLKKPLIAMMGVIAVYFIFGTIIQQIGDAFHVAWRIIPDYKGIAEFRVYWMITIATFFIAPIAYSHELFTKHKYEWQPKREYILYKTLIAILVITCAVIWYQSIVKYQTKFLM